MQLSSEQKTVFDNILKWHSRNPSGYLRVGGYAGTGKTTLISKLIDHLGDGVAVMALTGKAVDVLKSKGLDQAATIHSSIYNVIPEANNRVRFEVKDIDEIFADLIVVDESSMVTENIVKDIGSFGIPVLYVGDHGQLEPIGDSFNLMDDPDYALTEVHRQALDNPILRIATDIRNGVQKVDFNDPNYHNTQKIDYQQAVGDMTSYDVAICCSNGTRVTLNNSYRKQKWGKLDPDNSMMPLPGDRVMCYRNNRKYGISNGQNFSVEAAHQVNKTRELELVIKEEDDDDMVPGFGVRTSLDCFGAVRPSEVTKDRRITPFDYGYATTCHKAQGSEFGRVLVVYEPSFFTRPGKDSVNQKRWLYTAITRAKEHITITVR